MSQVIDYKEHKIAPENEATALSHLVNWSENLFPWQRDALRRLCQSATLTPTDITELVEICKGAMDKAQPITHEHIRSPKAFTKRVELKSIDHVENVNALATGQKLQFSASGITIVYGDNGSGKSGYVRILKQVCRARGSNTVILPNVYSTQTKTSKAKISFMVDGQNHQAEWIKDQTTEKFLSSVSVFDSSTANVYVSADNAISYVPFPMRLLTNLAEACKSIKSALQTEIDTLTAQTPNSIKSPQCRSGTAVGKVIADLKSNTNPQDLEKLTLSSDEEEKLKQLQSDLANDPEVIVRHHSAKLRRINELCEKADRLSSAIGPKQQEKLKGLYNEYEARKKTAELAAAKLFKNDPLPDVGGDTWKKLWESARRYSQEGAYIEKTFPVTDDDSHCVLCQQTLNADAKERLSRFEAFVTDDTKQQEEKAFNHFQQLHSQLATEQSLLTEIPNFVSFCKDDLNNAKLAEDVQDFFTKAGLRLTALLNQQDSLPDTPVWPKAIFDAEQAKMTKSISDLTADDAATTWQKLVAEKTELEDKKWLRVTKNDVLAEIERKKKDRYVESVDQTRNYNSKNHGRKHYHC